MTSPIPPSPPRPWSPWPATATRPAGVTVGCPAKVNLHLRVGPARADGFHPLLTWMCTVGLFDTLTIRSSADAPLGDEVPGHGPLPPDAADVRLSCDPPTVPADDRNLVLRVLRAWDVELRRAAGPTPADVTRPAPDRPPAAAPPGARRRASAALRKRTPVGAGLGGGSSDAAFALLVAARLWGAPPASADRPPGVPGAAGEPEAVTPEALSAVAARFGSDIPFFLRGPSAVCTGRGEVVRPVAGPAPRWAALLLPPVAMPTPDVYRRFDAMRLGRDPDVADEPDWAAWAALPATDLLPRLANDLEPPAFDLRPELAAWRAAAERAVGRPVRMSGSGSSLFTLFDARGEADAAAGELARSPAMAGVRVEVVEVAPAVPWAEDAAAGAP